MYEEEPVQTRGGGGRFPWQVAIDLECAALGAGRLDLKGTQPATQTRLNCLIDWPQVEGIFLKPLCVDQWVNERLTKPRSFLHSQFNYHGGLGGPCLRSCYSPGDKPLLHLFPSHLTGSLLRQIQTRWQGEQMRGGDEEKQKGQGSLLY